MYLTVNNKSYADGDFIALKKQFRGLLSYPEKAAPQLNMLRDVLQKWYGERFDIRFDVDIRMMTSNVRRGKPDIRLLPYLVVHYPELTIRNEREQHEMKNLFVRYDFIFVNEEKIGLSSDIYLHKSTFTAREMLVSYSHSHIGSSGWLDLQEIISLVSGFFSPKGRHVLNFSNKNAGHYCLGNDNIRHLFGDLVCDTDRMEAVYSYFFGYMDNLLTWENTAGAYPGQTIKAVKNMGTDNNVYTKQEYIGHNRGKTSLDYFVTQTLNDEFFEYAKPYIDKVLFDGKKLYIATMKEEFEQRLLNDTLDGVYSFGTMYEYEQEYYTKNNNARNNFPIMKQLVEAYESSKSTKEVGFIFRDQLIPIELILDMTEEDTSENLYKRVVSPTIMDSIYSFLNHKINILCYEKLCSNASGPAIKDYVAKERDAA